MTLLLNFTCKNCKKKYTENPGESLNPFDAIYCSECRDKLEDTKINYHTCTQCYKLFTKCPSDDLIVTDPLFCLDCRINNTLETERLNPVISVNQTRSNGIANPEMVHRQNWQDFSDAGFLWWVNQNLHLFGWSLVLEKDKETGEIVDAYPARTEYRGFDEKANSEGYAKVSEYLKTNIDDIAKEAKE